ncbi:MAG: GNAT family N-acetyltransferase [Planctomycetota bacterium]|jgi:GNAT superfamily N-acetyltransferase
MPKIYIAETNEDLEIAKQLFGEYLDFLKGELCEYADLPWLIEYYKDFEKELATLPGEYAPPTGCLLLAKYQDKVAGCVALRKLSDGVCKGKRLYVRPQFRGLKIGRKLMEAIIAEARKMGYSVMRGDTVSSMQAAQVLHASLGFEEIKPNHCDPIREAKFIELKLTQKMSE